MPSRVAAILIIVVLASVLTAAYHFAGLILDGLSTGARRAQNCIARRMRSFRRQRR